MLNLVITGVIIYFVISFIRKQRRIPTKEPFTPEATTVEELCSDLDIVTISFENIWQNYSIVKELKRRCKYNGIAALGFDCEWVSQGRRSPVALLQLSTFDGLCVLFRLAHMNDIPTELKDLLENKKILKLGVGAAIDAKYLYKDYNIVTQPFVDLRYVAEACDHEAGGLAALAKTHLNVILKKNLNVICSDWFKKTLTHEQITYAAADAYVATKIFYKMSNVYRMMYGSQVFIEKIQQYLNKDYYPKGNYTKKKKVNVKKGGNYKAVVLSKPLYDNCVLQAPDGELLSFIPEKKANWYLNKNLATQVEDDPLTIRLLFQPKGRAGLDENGESYYKLSKENICVTCGADGLLIRKCVVPKQYKKHFPVFIKDCSSHDVLLLCLRCHERSSLSDLAMSRQLAAMCGAPLNNEEHQPKDKVQSYARTLLNRNNNIPEERRRHLGKVILESYPQYKEITTEMLEKIANTKQSPKVDPDKETHSDLVVKYFKENKGILELEKMWRQHFLDTMSPAYLPKLWSVRHTEERLLNSINAGFLKQEDLKAIGIQL